MSGELKQVDKDMRGEESRPDVGDGGNKTQEGYQGEVPGSSSAGPEEAHGSPEAVRDESRDVALRGKRAVEEAGESERIRMRVDHEHRKRKSEAEEVERVRMRMNMEDRKRKSEEVGFQKEAKYKQEGEGGEEMEEDGEEEREIGGDRESQGGRSGEDEVMSINLVTASEFWGGWATKEEGAAQGSKRGEEKI